MNDKQANSDMAAKMAATLRLTIDDCRRYMVRLQEIIENRCEPRNDEDRRIIALMLSLAGDMLYVADVFGVVEASRLVYGKTAFLPSGPSPGPKSFSRSWGKRRQRPR